jgi:hypothetical protein
MAPQLIEAPRTTKAALPKWYHDTPRHPQSRMAIVGAVSACLAKCAQIADSEVAGFGH